MPAPLVRLLLALAGVAAITFGSITWFQVSNPAIVSASYLMVVLLVAATSPLWVAVVTSFTAMLCLNFFFLPPLGSFFVTEAQNWVVLFAFLAVSLLGSNLSAMARARTEQALVRAQLVEERRKAELSRQSEELKTALLASIGHDLRTPLTAIRVAAGNLKASWLTETDRQEQADLVTAEVERLTHLFENVLEMVRIDAGAVRSESRLTHPSEIVSAAQQQVEHSLQQHAVDVSLDSDQPVRVDPRLTTTALARLLENAAQYGPPQSTIHLSAGIDGTALRISVRDHGPGLTADDFDHLFERFFRGQAAKARASSTGMGLWIARGLLAAEGGTLTAANATPAGAVFTIVVPVAVSEPASLEATPS